MASFMLVLFLNVAVGTVLAGSDLDRPEACLQGPDFWCKDVATAAKCKKEDYCQIYELTSPLDQEGLEDKDKAHASFIKCAFCTKIVQKIKDLVGDDPSEEKIEEAIRNICKVLGPLLRGTCKNFLRLFKAKLLEDLQKDMGTWEICVDLKICKRGLMAPPVVAGSELGPLEACLQGPEFWCKDVAAAIECQQEEYCSTHEWTSLLDQEGLEDKDKTHASFIKCALCTKIVQKIKDLIGDDPSEEKIEEAIRDICKVLGRFLRGTCKNFLRLFKAKLLEDLQKGMGTWEICVDLKICKRGLMAPPEVESIEGSW